MLDNLQGRGVPPRRGGVGPRIGCPVRGCDGTMYQVKEGELLQRSPRGPGWKMVQRNCECPKCGHRQKIGVQVREVQEDPDESSSE